MPSTAWAGSSSPSSATPTTCGTARTHPVLGPATMSVGIISGGTSVNTVPEECHIEIDRRLLPGEGPQEAIDDLLAFLRKDASIDFPFRCEPPWSSKRALSPDNSAGLVADLGQVIDTVRGKHQVIGVPYGTDGSTISESGVPTVVFGPGDIARAAHRRRVGAARRGRDGQRDPVSLRVCGVAWRSAAWK